MAEPAKEKEKVPVRKSERKVEQEHPDKTPEPQEQRELPRRWHRY